MPHVSAQSPQSPDLNPDTFTYVLHVSGPALSSDETDDPTQRATEVTILWDNQVLYREHLKTAHTFNLESAATAPGPWFSRPWRRHSVGHHFLFPEQLLQAPRLPLIAALNGAAILLLDKLPPGCDGVVESAHGAFALDWAKENARQRGQYSAAHGSHYWRLGDGGMRLRLGAFDIVCQAVAAGKSVPRALFSNLDTDVAGYFGLSVASVSALLASAAFFTPPLTLTAGEQIDHNDLISMQQYLDAAAEREEKQKPEAGPENSESTSGESGERAKNEEGAMGDTSSSQRNQRYAVAGPKDNPDPHLARDRALHEAATFGLVGLLQSGMAGDPNAPTAPWGRESALGMDDQSANGGMWADGIGSAFGAGGIGLTGGGVGGGGPGEGIGVGAIGTFNRGLGNNGDYGFGRGHGRMTGGRQTRGIRMRTTGTQVSGRLPKEVIQRIVRQNYGRFRLCYERGLASNPGLEGRVGVRFVIGRDGAVSNAGNGGSSLASSDVVGCVVRAFYGLSFPKPEGGLVTVTYPIMFSPE